MTPSFDWDTFEYSFTHPTELATDQRWSTWGETAHTLDRGPQPFPAWVVQHDGAVDTELGILKTGKEADAFLIDRSLPSDQLTGRPGEATLMVAKRYRSTEHSAFHRSAAYTEGRRVRDSREARAMARGTAFGRKAAASNWARTEFDTLSRLWSAGLAVPYPVQIVGTELCMEFIGTETEAGLTSAPRLAETSGAAIELVASWREQLLDAVLLLAGLGLAHGDLSPYNVLVDNRPGREGRLVIIDVPQVVDLVANPNGAEFLARDCRNVCTWLTAHGAAADPDEWLTRALAEIQM